MTRQSRQLSETGLYHVMLRGNERKNIFQDDKYKQHFLDGVEAKGNEVDFAVHAYCVMNNHVHLVINSKSHYLAAIMKSIAVRFAAFYNWKQGRVGHVFQDRFKSEPIADDSYLLAAVRYIHNNPVKASIAGNPADYRWSSYSEYLQPTGREWLDTQFVLNIFNDNRIMALKEFERFSSQEDNAAFIDITEDVKAVRTVEEGRSYLSEYLQDRYQEIDVEQINTNKQMQTEIIRHLRTDTGLSQRVIASLLGIKKGVVERVKP